MGQVHSGMIDKPKIIKFTDATKPNGIIATFDEFQNDLENDVVTDFIILAERRKNGYRKISRVQCDVC